MEVKVLATSIVHTDTMLDAGFEVSNEFGNLNYDSDELAEFAGRTCYLSYDRPNPATRSNKDYLANILKQQHESVLAHASVTFFVTGMSRACAHELIRHRFLAFSEVSQRYVAPTKILEACSKDPVLYDVELEEYESDFHMHILTGAGVKAARGEARRVLPLGFPTAMVVSGNIRAWRDMIKQRLSPHADREIREFATQVLRHLMFISPNSTQDLVSRLDDSKSVD